MRGLGDLEAVIVDLMWRRGRPATVRQVLELRTAARPVAYTTVMPVMDNLHRRGFLTRLKEGRAWLYEPAMTREEHTARLMHDALTEVDNHAAALSHFLAAMTESETQALRWFVPAIAEQIGVVCWAVYGTAVAVFGPLMLRPMTGDGYAPRLGISIWLIAALLVFAAWGAAAVHAVAHGSPEMQAAAGVAAGVAAANHPAARGKLVDGSATRGFGTFVRDYGHGEFVVTHVLWVQR